jgi:hypothetical protein
VFWIKRHLYYQVKKGEVTVTSLEDGKSITRACSALNHPRTLMGNFMEIEDCFKSIAKELAPRRFLLQAPIAVVHLLESVEGGYTNVEIRAFREAALGAGARDTFMPSNKSKLSETQILSRDFAEWDCV